MDTKTKTPLMKMDLQTFAAQTFNPDKVMLADSLGKEVSAAPFTQEFLNQLVSTSKVVQLGERIEMGNQRMVRKSNGIGELSDAYFVGEGEKIGTAKVEGSDYVLESRKIAVILPVTEEFLTYTWSSYFNQVVPLIVDKFNKKIDGAAFLGLHGDVFGSNVLGAAKAAGNAIEGELTTDAIYDLQALSEREPNAFIGHRTLNRTLRGLTDGNGANSEFIFDRPATPTANGALDGLPYAQLQLANGETYPENTLITGNFNGLKYGVPNGADLRLKIADQATLSKVQNAGPDTGDVHMFEQDMQALRAIFEIAVAVPNGKDFAVLEPVAGV